MKSIAEAVSALWEKSADKLTTEELEFFSEASDLAGTELENLSQVLQSIGCLINADVENTGSFQSKKSTSSLLFSVSHQLDALKSLVEIGDAASYRLLNRAKLKTDAQ